MCVGGSSDSRCRLLNQVRQLHSCFHLLSPPSLLACARETIALHAAAAARIDGDTEAEKIKSSSKSCLIIEMPLTFSPAPKKTTVVYVKPLPQGVEWNSTYQTYTAPVAKSN